MAKKGWSKKTLRLRDDHTWTSKPGYKIFVADRGAVRFDIPQDWVVIPGEDAIAFHDRQPPDDDCTMKLSVMRLPAGVDWSLMPTSRLIRELTGREDDSRNVLSRAEPVDIRRGALEISWTEETYIDPGECRVAHGRTCLARLREIQPLITFAYWHDDAERVEPAWDELLSSLQLGLVIADPRRGLPR